MPYPPYPKLSKAPIVEAVIELKVRTHAPIEVTALTPVKEALADRFKISRDMHYVETGIRMDEAGAPQQTFSAAPIGVRLDSTDKAFVVLARVDGLSVSKLAPYDTWEGLRDMARDVWPVYTKALNPAAITRIGVRYINRIELREELIDFDKVLTAGPKIPSAMPQALTEFFSRIVVPIFDRDATVTISQTFQPSAPIPQDARRWASVIVDVDAFVERAFEIADDAGIWHALESLREVKNMAFFNSITAETLETLK